MLSVVIPVHNALEAFKSAFLSVVYNSTLVSEIIIVDDMSDFKTKAFISGLRCDIPLQKITNKRHLWTNGSWNRGVAAAKYRYKAVLNSDIVVPKGWDETMLDGLKNATISCPEKLPRTFHDKYFRMIRGECFMFEDDLFPIPKLKHWCGDNYLSDLANKKKGIAFTSVSITHQVEASAKTLPPREYFVRIYQDCVTYHKMVNTTGSRELVKMTFNWLPQCHVCGNKSVDKRCSAKCEDEFRRIQKAVFNHVLKKEDEPLAKKCGLI